MPRILKFLAGGGVILPEEIKDLMDYGIAKIFSPDDGRSLGLQGMINELVQKAVTCQRVNNSMVLLTT